MQEHYLKGNFHWLNFEVFKGIPKEDKTIIEYDSTRFSLITIDFSTEYSNEKTRFITTVNKTISWNDAIVLQTLFHYAFSTVLFYLWNTECYDLPKNNYENILGESIDKVENYSYREFSDKFIKLFPKSYNFHYLLREYENIRKKYVKGKK